MVDSTKSHDKPAQELCFWRPEGDAWVEAPTRIQQLRSLQAVLAPSNALNDEVIAEVFQELKEISRLPEDPGERAAISASDRALMAHMQGLSDRFFFGSATDPAAKEFRDKYRHSIEGRREALAQLISWALSPENMPVAPPDDSPSPADAESFKLRIAAALLSAGGQSPDFWHVLSAKLDRAGRDQKEALKQDTHLDWMKAISRESSPCTLAGAGVANLLSRVKAIIAPAANALGWCPADGEPEDFWIRVLYQDLSQASDDRRLECIGPIIPGFIASSSGLCLRLAARAEKLKAIAEIQKRLRTAKQKAPLDESEIENADGDDDSNADGSKPDRWRIVGKRAEFSRLVRQAMAHLGFDGSVWAALESWLDLLLKKSWQPNGSGCSSGSAIRDLPTASAELCAELYARALESGDSARASAFDRLRIDFGSLHDTSLHAVLKAAYCLLPNRVAVTEVRPEGDQASVFPVAAAVTAPEPIDREALYQTAQAKHPEWARRKFAEWCRNEGLQPKEVHQWRKKSERSDKPGALRYPDSSPKAQAIVSALQK